MQRVALTGGIATGKSHVRARLDSLGIPCVDADAIVHGLLGPGTPPTAAVEKRFGDSILQADGSVDRRALGRLVFADERSRADLEGILHPLVYASIADWMAEREAAGVAAAVADIPLLFETGHEGDFDLVVVVACEPDEQVRRVMARNGLSEPEARARLASQLPIAEKVAAADIVIRTDGAFEETDRQVDALAKSLISNP